MHTVECPHCHRKFKVPRSVVNARMKCSRCGEVFVGSSSESEEAPAGFAPPSPYQARLAARARPMRTRTSGPVVLAVCVAGAVGIVALLVALAYIRENPSVTEVTKGPTAADDRIVRHGAGEGKEVLRKIQEAQRMRPASPGPGPGEGPDVQPGPGPARVHPGTTGDAKLVVSRPAIVETGAVGERKFVCGRVLSHYTVPLRRLQVTVLVDGKVGETCFYPHIPPQGRMRFTIPVQGEGITEDRVTVVAKAEPAGGNEVVWEIPPEQVKRSGEGVWTGKTRNPLDTPVRGIRIILDYFAGDGVWGGRAEGTMQDTQTLGVGKTGFFRVSTGDFNAMDPATSALIVARAVAEKF